MAPPTRPLSPHVGIYRWQISNTLSILHRLTGVLLSVAALILGSWVLALAAGPAAFGRLHAVLASPPGLLVLAATSFCFFYHLCNGVRHLVWDAGFGFDKAVARASGIFVVVIAAAMTAAFWGFVLTNSGAAQ